MARRKLRFVPFKVQERDFRKWAKSEGYKLPRSDSPDWADKYVQLHGMTADDLFEVFRAGFEAGEQRQAKGGAGCGD